MDYDTPSTSTSTIVRDDSPSAGTRRDELAGLLGCRKLERLLQHFCDAVGMAAAIIDLSGNVLVGARWQWICTHLHRVHPERRSGAWWNSVR